MRSGVLNLFFFIWMVCLILVEFCLGGRMECIVFWWLVFFRNWSLICFLGCMFFLVRMKGLSDKFLVEMSVKFVFLLVLMMLLIMVVLVFLLEICNWFFRLINRLFISNILLEISDVILCWIVLFFLIVDILIIVVVCILVINIGDV